LTGGWFGDSIPADYPADLPSAARRGRRLTMRNSKKFFTLGTVFLLLSGCAAKKCDFSSDYIVQADGSNRVSLNDSTNEARIAQRFRPNSAVTVYSVSFTVRKVGTPEGKILVSIRTDDHDKPDDKAISDGGPVEADLTGVGESVLTEVEVKLTGHPDLSSDRDYYIVLEPSVDPSPDSYYELGSVTGSSGGAYADGEMWRFDSLDTDKDTAWSKAPTVDLQFTVKKCEESKSKSSSG
jgi:hypothetical protein